MLVLVIAQTNEEFRDLVLQDTNSLGSGGATFLKGEDKVVNWRSSIDPSHKVRYVWAKDYQEARDAVDEDHFRILGRNTKPSEKPPISPEIMLVLALTAFVAGAIMIAMKG